MVKNDLILMGKRILEKEWNSLATFTNGLDESFADACKMILECRGHAILTGMGKSGHVARKWASTLSSTGTRAYFLDPAEASHGDLGVIHRDDLLIVLSYSGESVELDSVLRYAHEMSIAILGVTNRPDSSLAQASALTLLIKVFEEACPLGLAPTTSTTLMMALGDSIAGTIMQMRGFTERDFARLHPGGYLGRRLWLRVEDVMHRGDSLPVVYTSDPWEKVVLEMTSRRLGLAIVMQNEEVRGIITDGDLRRHLQKGTLAAQPLAHHLMTLQPKCISASALATEAREMMEKNLIHQLLVMDEKNRLVGVIHLHDLMKRKVI